MPSLPSPRQRTRAIGRAINTLVVRAPWAWPLVRGWVNRFFSRLAPEWDPQTGAGSVEHLAALAAGLLHVVPEPERALDVGTGTGEAALLVAREFPRARVRGVDISEEMIATARAKAGLDPEGRLAFRVGDASKLPWPEESFDLVVQLNVPPFFGELARVLRPGGQVVIASSHGHSTPFYTSAKDLRSGFAARGIEEVATGGAGPGEFWVGRVSA